MLNRGRSIIPLLSLMFVLSACGMIREVADELSRVVTPCNKDVLEGEGTEGSRFTVCTPEQLRLLEGSDKVFQLGDHINLSEEASFAPIANFKGKLYGNGYTISGHSYSNIAESKVGLFGELLPGSMIDSLTIEGSRLEGDKYVAALAGSIDGTGAGVVLNNITIKNSGIIGRAFVGVLTGSGLKFDINDLVISGSTISAEKYAGMIAGEVSSDLELNRAIVEGNVNGSFRAGGAFGECIECIVDRVAVMAQLNINSDSARFAFVGKTQEDFGLFVGNTDQSVYTNSYVLGGILSNASTANAIGGFVGRTQNSMYMLNHASLNTLFAKVGTNLDSFAGFNAGGNIPVANYVYQHANTANNGNGFATSLGLTEMKSFASFVGFDSEIWTMSTGTYKLPILKDIQDNLKEPFEGADFKQQTAGPIVITENQDVSGWTFPATTSSTFAYSMFTFQNLTNNDIYIKDMETILKGSYLPATLAQAGTCINYMIGQTPLYHNTSCTFGVRFNPQTAKVQDFTSDLMKIKYSIATKDGVIRALTQKVDGEEIPEEPNLSDDTLAFGNVIETNTSTLDYTLDNTGIESGRIISYTLSGSVFALDKTDCLEGTTLAPSDTCDLHIDFTPSAVAGYSETLTVLYENIFTNQQHTMVLTLTGDGITNPFPCGAGTLASPWCVPDRTSLELVSTYSTSYFIQTANIDLGGCGTPFTPIPDFSGQYDGDGFSIDNLCSTSSVGFMSHLGGSPATVKNIDFDSLTVTGTGAFYAADGMMTAYAGVVGWMTNATMDNVHVTNGSVTGGGHVTGGLAAIMSIINTTYVTNSSFSGTVTGNERVGGVVGYNRDMGEVSNSSMAGTVTGGAYVGGVIGAMNGGGVISGISSSADVTGNVIVGGLVGFLIGSTMDDSFITSAATVTCAGWACGGAIGYHYGGSSLNNVYSEADVVSTADAVGGLIGASDSGPNSITRTYATGDVTGVNNVGGLIGYINGDSVQYSYSAGGTVTGSQAMVGGLIGLAGSTSVAYCFSSDTVNGNTTTGGATGGFVGNFSSANIIQSFSTGAVTAMEAAGFAFYFSLGTIEDSFSTGSVTGVAGFGTTAGFVGNVAAGATINKSYSTGNVDGTSSSPATSAILGGGTVTNSYYFDYPANPGDVSGASGLNNVAGQEMNILANFTNFNGAWTIPLTFWNTSLGANANSPVPSWACDPLPANGINGVAWSTITGITCP